MATQMSTVPIATGKAARANFAGHMEIARFDHWVKNVFVLPGIVAAFALNHESINVHLIENILIGLVAIGFIASSNYILNEVMDAPFDSFHPIKLTRPVPSGKVNIPLAYLQWIAFAAVGIGLGLMISKLFVLTLLALWIMGCIYNIPPVRSKDVPYLDVLTEAINNPIRLLAGWFMVSTVTMAPGSLLLSYWMVGCYFMALKRYAEYLRLKEGGQLGQYRKSLAFFTAEGLMVSVMFYGSSAMLFFGAFLMRYRLELVLSFPFVALVMAIYLSLGFKRDSAVEHPEKLYRERDLMGAVVLCALVMTLCFLVDMPKLYKILTPTAPISRANNLIVGGPAPIQ
jgi:decaprenyl-phosphate phosphoribosyltransferase